MSDIPPQMAPQGMPDAMHPGMILNPAYTKWEQDREAWIAEKQKRDTQFQQACELIKNDAAKGYKIDIEADSTIAADEQAEKAARTEFVAAVVPLLGEVLPQMQASPALAKLGKAILMFGIRGFPQARTLEDEFESALDSIVQSATNGGGGPPPQSKGNTKSPMEIQAEAETERTKAKVQMASVQQDAQESALKAQSAQQANALKALQLQQQATASAEELKQDQLQHEQTLMQREREIESHERMDQARMNRMASRNAEGLE